MKKFKQFREDTSFAAAVPANAVGAGTAIANIDPMLNGKKKRLILKRRFVLKNQKKNPE